MPCKPRRHHLPSCINGKPSEAAKRRETAQPQEIANLISYEGKEYEREQFLTEMFPQYKKHDYKVRFKIDNVFYLSSSQRAKLAYRILAQNYDLVEVAEQDKRDLERIAKSNKAKTYQIWHDRMKWKNGHEKLMTFGAALEVKGAAKGVFCAFGCTKQSAIKYQA